MNRFRFWLIVLAIFIAGLNVWSWWPSGSSQKIESASTRERWTPEVLKVRTAVDVEKVPPARRDLFQPKYVVVKAAPKPKIPELPPAPPPKTPEQIAEETARVELSQIRLVGVVFRGGNGEAFLVKGDQTYMVRQGEKVGDRFMVESIQTDAVALKDPMTQVSGSLSVSGK